MRELLFRGKTVRDGRWLISESISQFADGRVYLYDEVKDIDVEVIPQTVGQFSGGTDVHGVNIFGDVIKKEYTLWHTETKNERKTQIGVVMFDKCEYLASGNTGCFGIKHVWSGDYIEIIGTRYDNEDLL